MTRLGVLAEDATDCETIRELVAKIVERKTPNWKLGVSSRDGRGGARLRRKAGEWMADLAVAGCTGFVILHDLDRDPVSKDLNDEIALRAELEAHVFPEGTSRIVCIPVEEIEAWFWADPAILKAVGKCKPPKHRAPDTIPKPKEALIDLSYRGGTKPTYSTNSNPSLAKKLDIDLCTKHCSSFSQFRGFVESLCTAVTPRMK